MGEKYKSSEEPLRGSSPRRRNQEHHLASQRAFRGPIPQNPELGRRAEPCTSSEVNGRTCVDAPPTHPEPSKFHGCVGIHFFPEGRVRRRKKHPWLGANNVQFDSHYGFDAPMAWGLPQRRQRQRIAFRHWGDVRVAFVRQVVFDELHCEHGAADSLGVRRPNPTLHVLWNAGVIKLPRLGVTQSQAHASSPRGQRPMLFHGQRRAGMRQCMQHRDVQTEDTYLLVGMCLYQKTLKRPLSRFYTKSMREKITR